VYLSLWVTKVRGVRGVRTTTPSVAYRKDIPALNRRFEKHGLVLCYVLPTSSPALIRPSPTACLIGLSRPRSGKPNVFPVSGGTALALNRISRFRSMVTEGWGVTSLTPSLGASTSP
jgi:hypothetical protein